MTQMVITGTVKLKLAPKAVLVELNKATVRAKDNSTQDKYLKAGSNLLTKEELLLLDKLYQNRTLPDNLQNVLRYFLFSCFTGIRCGDIYELRFSNVKEADNITYLDFIQLKTKKPAIIRLINQAKALMPPKEFEGQRVFNVLVNQATNRHLKTIMEMVKINKLIVFHSGRLSFYNTLCLMDGVNIMN